MAATRRKWVAPGLILQARDWTSEDQETLGQEALLRVGFTASRKVGSAVVRNRAKRRLRELARRILPDSGASSVDLVLIARTETATRAFGDLEADLRQAIAKLVLPGTRRDRGGDARRGAA